MTKPAPIAGSPAAPAAKVPEDWPRIVAQSVDAGLSWLPVEEVERLARRYCTPSAIRRRRLGERDEAIRRLAAWHPDVASGRELAGRLRGELLTYATQRRPKAPEDHPRLALLHRILVLNLEKAPSEPNIRRALAGMAQNQPRF